MVVAFLLECTDEAGKAAKAAEETVQYIQDNGIDAFVADGKDPLPLSALERIKTDALVLTDSPDRAKELSEKGFYCVGLLHEGNAGASFPGLKYIFSDIEEVDMDSFVKVYQRYAGEPWEILETDRLIVRETTLEDVDEFYKIYADPEMTMYMEGLFEDPEDEKRYQKDYIDKVYTLMGFGVWTLVRKDDDRIIGRAGYSVRNGFDEPELGFLVGKEFQRNGYCLEALRAILDYGRDVLQFDKVQALVKAENEVSIHVLERLGFTKDAEVNVEENIYGDQYSDGQRVSLGGSSYGKYVRMIFLW
jgi:RimJ/RimL family protein N-acetyltransferase